MANPTHPPPNSVWRLRSSGPFDYDDRCLSFSSENEDDPEPGTLCGWVETIDDPTQTLWRMVAKGANLGGPVMFLADSAFFERPHPLEAIAVAREIPWP